MRRHVCQRIAVCAALVLGLTVWATGAQAIPVVSLQPPSTAVLPGGSVTLDVAVSGVTDLFAFQFDVLFTPTILAATGVNEGPFLPSGGATFFLPGTIDNTVGAITFTANTLLGLIPGVSGSGTLASLTFEALTAGSSAITLANVLLFDSLGAPMSFSTQGGTVNVVPEPGTWALFGVGLLGLGLVRRRWHLAATPGV